MANEENTISIVIKAVNQMSTDLKQVEGDLARLQGTADRTSGSTETLTNKTVNLHRRIVPLAGAFRNITGAIATTNPQFAVLISSTDNLAFAMINAASGSASFGAGLKAGLRAILNPVTLGVIALVAAIGYLINKFLEVRQASEDTKKALEAIAIEQAKLNANTQAGAIEAERSARIKQILADLAEKEKNAVSGLIVEKDRQVAAEQIAQINAKLDLDLQKFRKQTIDNLIVSLKEEALRTEMLATLYPKEQEEIAALNKELDIYFLIQKTGIPIVGKQADEINKYTDSIYRNAVALRQRKEAEEEELKDLDRLEEIHKKVRVAAEAEEKQAKATASSMAQSFTDTLIQITQATGTGGGIKQIFSNMGATIGKEIVQAMIAEMITAIIPQAILAQFANKTIGGGLFEMLKNLITGAAPSATGGAQLAAAGTILQTAGTGLETAAAALIRAAAALAQSATTGGGGEGGGAGGFIGALAALFGGGAPTAASYANYGAAAYALAGQGMMVMPPGAIQKFQRGGVVRGPVMGMIGEEGPEIVARMKPMRPQDEGEPIHQNIYLVDRRPPRLGPNDVVAIVDDSINKMGRVGKSVYNVVRRGR